MTANLKATLLRLVGAKSAARAYGPDSQQGRRHIEVADIVARELVPKGGAHRRALDIGSGQGWLIQMLRPYFDELHGCDWVDLPLALDGYTYQRLDLNEQFLTPYSSRYFDLVVASDVLEHLENPARMLREISRVLKTDGVVIISLPNAWNVFERIRFLLTGRLKRYRSERDSGPWGHISVFTIDTLQSLFDRASLQITSIEGGYANVRRILFTGITSTLLSYNLYVIARWRNTSAGKEK